MRSVRNKSWRPFMWLYNAKNWEGRSWLWQAHSIGDDETRTKGRMADLNSAMMSSLANCYKIGRRSPSAAMASTFALLMKFSLRERVPRREHWSMHHLRRHEVLRKRPVVVYNIIQVSLSWRGVLLLLPGRTSTDHTKVRDALCFLFSTEEGAACKWKEGLNA